MNPILEIKKCVDEPLERSNILALPVPKLVLTQGESKSVAQYEARTIYEHNLAL